MLKDHPVICSILTSFGTFLIAHQETTEVMTSYLKFLTTSIGFIMTIWFVYKEYKKHQEKKAKQKQI